MPDGSGTARAIDYSLKRWEALTRYGGIRHYVSTDVARVKFVKSGQRLGFSLDEIGQLLILEDGAHCSEAALSRLISDCHAIQGNVSCPLIAALQQR